MIHEQQDQENNFAAIHVNDNQAPGSNMQQIENDINLIHDQDGQQKFDERLPIVEYENDEDELVCGRFPHLDVCACEISCQIALKEINLFQVYPGIFMGPYQSSFKTQDLIEKGVTHVLNVSCKEYTKRSKYFKYLDIHVTDDIGENASKYFRITNRFLDDAVKNGAVLVHSVQGKSRAPTFILAYLIYREKMKLKDGLTLLREYVNEVEPNESFMQQLADYDLEQLSKNAFGK